MTLRNSRELRSHVFETCGFALSYPLGVKRIAESGVILLSGL